MPANPFTSSVQDIRGDRETVWQRRRRACFDRAAVSLIALGGARGLGCLHMAAIAWAHTGLERPSARDLMTLFPHLPPPSAAAVARRSSALRALNRAAIALVQRDGLPALAPFVSPRPSTLALSSSGGTGAVMVGFHLGVHSGLGAALTAWREAPLILPAQPLVSAEQRARVLKRATDYVRGGGIALVAIDGPGGLSTEPVTCLGRRIAFRRGPFALARQTGAPVLPAVARWTASWAIEVSVGPVIRPDHPGVSESAMAAAVATWLEAHLLAHPEDLWPYTIRNLLEAPTVEGGS